jgi:hypothetical protein
MQTLSLITHNQFGPVPQLLLTDYHCVYPFRVEYMLIPTETVGFFYIIISKIRPILPALGKPKISAKGSIHTTVMLLLQMPPLWNFARMPWQVFSLLLDWLDLLDWNSNRIGGYFAISPIMNLHMQ